MLWTFSFLQLQHCKNKLNIFYVRYDDGIGNNGSNGNYMVTAEAAKAIFSFYVVFL
jgi:hypothetical protein